MMKHSRATFLCCLLAFAATARPAGADMVYLKKGGKIKGVISSETEGSIEIKSNLGTIILSKGAISNIERASPEENSALEAQWQKERDEEKEKVKEAKRFEEEQRAKGLVKYRGTWVPADKAYEIESGVAKEKEDWQKTVEQQKKDLQDMEARLKDLQIRLEQRERDIDAREQQLTLRERNLLLQQQNLQRQAEQAAREKQETPPKIFAVPRIDVVPPAPRQP